MKHELKSMCLILGLFFVCAQSCPVEAEPQNDFEIMAAFRVLRTKDFLKEPGNCQTEILRRFGRSLNRQLESDDCLYASVFDKNKINDPNFLRPIAQDMLTKAQKQKAKELLDLYKPQLIELANSCMPASESLIITAAAKSAGIRGCLERQIAFLNTKAAEQNAQPRVIEQIKKLQTETLPVFEASDYAAGALVVSENGCFGRLDVVSSSASLLSKAASHDISIGGYINDKHLMSFCQTHPIENPSEAYKQIAAMPQAAMVLNMLASAGLNLEKDILSNAARESILYVNLEPKSQNGPPEIIAVLPVPNVKKLIDDLPKYKKLCLLSGVFVQNDAETPDIVRLSHFINPKIGIYAGLENNLLIIAAYKSSVISEKQHIARVNAASIKPFKLERGLKRYWQIHTDDFNRQLQIMLQSKFLQNKGIPPISNLTFLSDMQTVVVTTHLSPQRLSFRINLPLRKK